VRLNNRTNSPPLSFSLLPFSLPEPFQPVSVSCRLAGTFMRIPTSTPPADPLVRPGKCQFANACAEIFSPEQVWILRPFLEALLMRRTKATIPLAPTGCALPDLNTAACLTKLPASGTSLETRGCSCLNTSKFVQYHLALLPLSRLGTTVEFLSFKFLAKGPRLQFQVSKLGKVH
jgi:hypothetical protein